MLISSPFTPGLCAEQSTSAIRVQQTLLLICIEEGVIFFTVIGKMENRVWSLEFTADDDTDDVSGQVATVAALCKARSLPYVEEMTLGDGGDYHILLPVTTEGDKLDQLIIDATRKGCRVIAVIRDQFPETLDRGESWSRMAALDDELWSQTCGYDKEKNEKTMEQNLASHSSHQAEPYSSKWHHSSQDSSDTS
jgi:hypothetical protein